MNDKELLKLLGLKDRSINISLDYKLQKQVEHIVNERLEQIEKQESHDVVDGLLRNRFAIEFGRNNRIRMDASSAFGNAVFQKQYYSNLLNTTSRRARTTA